MTVYYHEYDRSITACCDRLLEIPRFALSNRTTKPPSDELTPAGCWHWEAVTRRARSNFRPVWTISACRKKQSAAIHATWQWRGPNQVEPETSMSQALTVSKPSMLSASCILESRGWYQNHISYFSCWNFQRQTARAGNKDNYDLS